MTAYLIDAGLALLFLVFFLKYAPKMDEQTNKLCIPLEEAGVIPL
jgi:hypothetical protein